MLSLEFTSFAGPTSVDVEPRGTVTITRFNKNQGLFCEKDEIPHLSLMFLSVVNLASAAPHF